MRAIAKAPSVLGCAVFLAAVRLHLKLRGFGPSLSAARGLAAGVRAAHPDPVPLIERTTAAIVTAAAFFPGRAVCLEQSLALFVLLRRRGIPVDLKLGVQPFPFTAHAWVEHAGIPVNENPDQVRCLLPLSVVRE